MNQTKASTLQEKPGPVEIYLESLANFLLKEVGKVQKSEGNENGNKQLPKTK